jgi:hypothetical protein
MQRKGGPYLWIDAVRSVSDGDVGHTASISRTSKTNSAHRDLVEKGEKKKQVREDGMEQIRWKKRLEIKVKAAPYLELGNGTVWSGFTQK